MARHGRSLLLVRGLPAGSLVGSGILFWGCLVITDPVTTTSKPGAGLAIGLLAGFIPGALGGTGLLQALGILGGNILSYLADRFELGPGPRMKRSFGKTQRVRFSPADTPFIDLTGSPSPAGTPRFPPVRRYSPGLKPPAFSAAGAGRSPPPESSGRCWIPRPRKST
jgi:hypothetical protein